MDPSAGLPPEMLALLQASAGMMAPGAAASGPTAGGLGNAELAAFYLRLAAAAAGPQQQAFAPQGPAQQPGGQTYPFAGQSPQNSAQAFAFGPQSQQPGLDPLSALLLLQAQASSAALQQPLSLSLPANQGGGRPEPKRREVACEECGELCASTRALLVHLRDLHGELIDIHACQRCDFAARSAARLARHCASAHGDEPSETDSDKDSPLHSAASQQLPLQAQQPPEPKLRCTSCPYETSDEGRYKKHLRCHKTSADTRCRLCDFSTVYSWNLDRHMRSHRSRGRYTCMRCSFSQNTRQSITFHLQHHHSPRRAHQEAQTEAAYEGPLSVDCAGEAFVFEQHAVRCLSEEELAALTTEDSDAGGSPASSVSPAGTGGAVGSVKKEPQESKPPHGGAVGSVKKEPQETKPPHQPSTYLQKSGFKERFLSHFAGRSEISSPLRKRAASEPEEEAIEDPALGKAAAASPSGGKKTAKLDETAVRKYLSESDAIETPSEERDFKELEKDPDVETRVCSICGYQGKWISEMIRHKRVHTNERPFKCRYCNRTSKWKADLIRHVAKVHGIRVVSKYSRSKTFDSDAGMMRALKEQHGFVDAALASDASAQQSDQQLLGLLQDVATVAPDGSSLAFRCRWCALETPDVRAMLDHAAAQHAHEAVDASGMEEEASGDVGLGSSGRPGDQGPGSGLDKGPVSAASGWEPLDESPMDESPSSTASGLAQGTSGLVSGSGLAQSRMDPSSAPVSLCSSGLSSAPGPTLAAFGSRKSSAPVSTSSAPGLGQADPSSAPRSRCSSCPFEASSELALMAHRKGHAPPAGLLNYKCAFCRWYAKRKPAVLEHMRLHTERPEEFLDEVDLITPATPTSPLKANNPPSAVAPVCPLDLGRSKSQVQAPDSKPLDQAPSKAPKSKSGVMGLAFSDVTELAADFSAIIDAAGGGDLGLASLRDSAGHFPVNYTTKWKADGGDYTTKPGDYTIKPGEAAKTELDSDMYKHAGLPVGEIGSGLVPCPPGKPSELRKVSAVHEGALRRLWQCRFCPHASKRRSNVKAHERRHGRLMEERGLGELLQCSFREANSAPKDFRSALACDFRGDRRSLNAHVGVHSEALTPPAGLVACVVCPAVFRSSVDLQTHSGGHGGGKAFACGRCNYTAEAREGLGHHEKVHSEAEEEAEEAAGKAARAAVASPATLAASPKPKKHTCPSCPARFADTTQLSRHVRFHGGSAAFRCPQCDYAVPYQINLIKHLKAHHGPEDPPNSGQAPEATSGLGSGLETTSGQALEATSGPGHPEEDFKISFKTHQRPEPQAGASPATAGLEQTSGPAVESASGLDQPLEQSGPISNPLLASSGGVHETASGLGAPGALEEEEAESPSPSALAIASPATTSPSASPSPMEGEETTQAHRTEQSLLAQDGQTVLPSEAGTGLLGQDHQAKPLLDRLGHAGQTKSLAERGELGELSVEAPSSPSTASQPHSASSSV